MVTATGRDFSELGAVLEKGQTVAEREYVLTRDSLVRYAGASGDFNPIHYRDDVAQAAGLDGVLAHGMLTMGAATAVISDWVGSDGFVVDVQARFTRPVVVDPQTGATVTVTAVVHSVDEETRSATFNLNTVYGEKTVLAKAQAVVRFN